METNNGDNWIVVVCIRTIHLEVNTFRHSDHDTPRASVAHASLQQCSAADNQLSLSILGSLTGEVGLRREMMLVCLLCEVQHIFPRRYTEARSVQLPMKRPCSVEGEVLDVEPSESCVWLFELAVPAFRTAG